MGVSVLCPSCFEAFEVPSPGLAEVPCDIDYDCEICCRPMRVSLWAELSDLDECIRGEAYSIED